MSSSSALREVKTRSPSWRLQAKAEIETRKRKGIYRTATDTVAVSAFEDWLGVISPTWQWQWQHLCFIRKQLDRITHERLKRLMLFVPPRHGKSEMVTIRYPVWRLERSPSMRVIIAAYNQTLVNKFSRKARAIARRRMILSEHRTAVEEWETTAGGGLRSVGVGVGITGQGGDLIIIDDPVKNRAEANSLTYREHVWEWYRDDLYTRQEPGCAMVLIMCMTGNTRILMAGGSWRPLDTIRPGEHVMTWDNGELTERVVEAFLPQGKAKVYQVKTGNHTVSATGNHPFLVARDDDYEWVRTDELQRGDRLVVLGQWDGGENPRQLTEEDSWALGFMYGDGWVTHNPRKDTEAMRWVTCFAKGVYDNINERALCYFGERFGKRPNFKKREGYYRTEIAVAGRWFDSLGLGGGAKSKRVPDHVLDCHYRYVKRSF